MAYDDDYRRWRTAEDDRLDRAAQSARLTNATYEYLRAGDLAGAGALYGIPPAGPGSGAARTDPPTPEAEFRRHKAELLSNLNCVWGFDQLDALCRDWARRVEPLDLGQPEAGSAAIEAIREEYQSTAYRHMPPLTEPSSRMRWQDQVPRVGHEIEWLFVLFRQALALP